MGFGGQVCEWNDCVAAEGLRGGLWVVPVGLDSWSVFFSVSMEYQQRK